MIQRPVPVLREQPFSIRIVNPASAPEAKPHSPGTADFRYWTAAEALRRGADFWGALLPGTSWEVGSILPVDLDFGIDLNAFYDREGLKFFHGSAAGRTVFSGESPDVVCHELGHAILDSLKPQLFDAASIEVAAFHESFGDMSAILSALQLPSLREGVLAETGGVLHRASRLSRLAEQLGWAIRQSVPSAVEADCLRNAVNTFFYRDPDTLPTMAPATALSSEPHSFSRVFTGAFFEGLAGMLATTASRDEAALLHCEPRHWHDSRPGHPRRVRRADAIDGRPGRRYRARELRVRRVVAPVIVLRAAAEPQVIWHAGDGVERQVHVIRRRCRRRRDLRGTGVRMNDEVSPRGAHVVLDDPRARQCRRVRRP